VYSTFSKYTLSQPKFWSSFSRPPHSEFLIAEGVSPDRITAVGYGEMQPAEYEENPEIIHTEAAKANKRVVLTTPVQQVP
jgi:hypothetical protein